MAKVAKKTMIGIIIKNMFFAEDLRFFWIWSLSISI